MAAPAGGAGTGEDGDRAFGAPESATEAATRTPFRGVYYMPEHTEFNDPGPREGPFPWVMPPFVPKVAIVPTLITAPIPEASPFGPNVIMESCITKGILSTVVGGGMGVLMGVVMSTFDTSNVPVVAAGQPLPPPVPLKQQVRDMVKNMGVKSKQWAKSFAIVGGIFSTVECFIEKYRASHDLTNSVTAGCATGAVLSRNGGPQAMCLGCMGFAAFSVVIDKVMDN